MRSNAKPSELKAEAQFSIWPQWWKIKSESVTTKLTAAYCLRKAYRMRLSVRPMQWKTTRWAGALNDEAAWRDGGLFEDEGTQWEQKAHGWSRHASICTADRITWLKYGNTQAHRKQWLTNVALWFKWLAERCSSLYVELCELFVRQ